MAYDKLFILVNSWAEQSLKEMASWRSAQGKKTDQALVEAYESGYRAACRDTFATLHNNGKMTQKQRMAQRILNHGFDLKQIFFADPYSADPYVSPLAVAKALHRIEARMHRMAEAWCNGTVTEEQVDKAEASALKSIKRLLPKVAEGTIPVIVNLDPRGYALKIPSEYVRDNNLDIHRDWGGYGILAPEFDGRP